MRIGSARLHPRRLSIQVRLRSRTQEAKRFHRIVIFILLLVVYRPLQIKDAVERYVPVAQSLAKEDGDLMEQSIRNEIPGTVKEIISDKVLSEIIVETAVGDVAAIITTRSVHDMGLKVGDRVAALVKATNVSVRHQD
jgi:molybdopterin-binding protein